MSKTLPTTTRFSSTTSEPIFGGLSDLTMAFPEGDTFVILPNLCKRNSPLENMYLTVAGDLKLMGMYINVRLRCTLSVSKAY